MSTRDRTIITISIAGFACVIGYWLLLRPTSARLATCKHALATMQDELGDAVRLRRTSVERTMHEAGMWTAEESSTFLEELAQIAATHGARLVTVSVADPRRVNEPEVGADAATTIDYGLFEMKVSAKFQGAYSAIRHLLSALHDHEPRLQVTEVSLATGEGGDEEIAATTDMKYFVFQRAVGSEPAGPTPAVPTRPEVVAMAPQVAPLPSPFRRGPQPVAPPSEARARRRGPGLSVTVPPNLPEVAPEDEEAEEELPPAERGPTPVLTGILGGEEHLLAAISVGDRTRLYAAGDKLSEKATVAVVAREGIQITVARARGERTILARTGQPITAVQMPRDELGVLPGEGAQQEQRRVLPLSAGTVTGPSGAVGLIREEGRTYIARIGDVIGGGLKVVAIEDGNVFVADADAGDRGPTERIALRRQGG
jgi:hypothetical protein